MNLAFIIGNLGSEPVVRYFPDGTPVINFNVATTRRWKDKGGDQKEATTWHHCVKIGKGADSLAGHLRKGLKVAIVGEIRHHEWEQDGVKKNVSEILIKELEFLDKKSGTGAPDRSDCELDMDEDVPF